MTTEKHSTLIMGILNITPDSFSDGGLFNSPEKALKQIQTLIEDGADIIDIGAQASGPNSMVIPATEEIERLKMFIDSDKISDLLDRTTFSIDTYHSSVAKYAIGKGAKIVNDISGLRFDPLLAKIIADSDCQIVIMHSKEPDDLPHASNDSHSYKDIIQTISNFLEERIEFAYKNDIKPEQIILDPGMGLFLSPDPLFSKEVVEKADELKNHFRDFKVLYGVSRKSFIKKLYGDCLSNINTQKIELELIAKGIDIIRTHEPKPLKNFVNRVKENGATK